MIDGALVKKEIYRGNPLEALSNYHACTLTPLVEVLRMRYKPARYNFHTRYAYYVCRRRWSINWKLFSL
jgi:hypothetical protein